MPDAETVGTEGAKKGAAADAMMGGDPSELCARVRRRFVARFGSPPEGLVVCPGRVNLIGDHTDYAGGLAMPMAIDRHVVLAWGRGTTGDTIEIVSDALGAAARIAVSDGMPAAADAGPWVRHVGGICLLLGKSGVCVPSLRVLSDATLPIGAGLSSSAAHTIALATALCRASGYRATPSEMIELSRRVEAEFVGVPCGELDQTAIVHARAGCALLIDFGDHRIEHVPMAMHDAAWIVIDSRQRRMLANEAYGERRAQCEQAARMLGAAALGACTPVRLARSEKMPDAFRRRARHVIGECARVRAFAEAIRAGDLEAAGRLMYESHDSLRDDFAVSCDRLDLIREAGEEAGAPGVRLTGAGFGGCCVALVPEQDGARICEEIARAFESAFGERPRFLRVRPDEGVRSFDPSMRRLP